MRNIFDQYSQPENKLTHALCCTLAKDRHLIRPFLQWLGIESIPPLGDIKIVEQRIPGVAFRDDEEHLDDKGIPDLCLYSELPLDWVVLFEMKAVSPLEGQQLKRHSSSAKRAGYNSQKLIAITAKKESCEGLPSGTILKQWRDLYGWFLNRKDSSWASDFVHFLEAFEAKASRHGYELGDTLTMFNGLKFTSDNPYTYAEAKRQIRLLGSELLKREDLHALGVDPDGERRHGISDGDHGVWDYLPLRVARGKPATQFPHLTIVIAESYALAALTIPNGLAGGFRSRMKDAGFEKFLDLVRQVESGIHPVKEHIRPSLYATQRHFRARRSQPSVDGQIQIDLRACLESGSDAVKYQPEWFEAIYNLLLNKQSNIQFGFEILFDYSCQSIQSRDGALDLFANSWKAMKPMLDFVLGSCAPATAD